MTDRDTLPLPMPRPISVRLDDDALRALARLESTGLSRSEAIRTALVQAAGRLQERRALAVEVAALEADEADRAEMRAGADLMERLRATGGRGGPAGAHRRW